MKKNNIFASFSLVENEWIVVNAPSMEQLNYDVNTYLEFVEINQQIFDFLNKNIL